MSKLKKPRRPTKTISVRKYRKDKYKPKKLLIQIKEDLGRFEQIETLKMNEDNSINRTIIPKEKNPNLIYILKNPIKIGFYLDTLQCFAWSENGEYLGQLEKYHFKKLFSKIGELLKKHGNKFP